MNDSVVIALDVGTVRIGVAVADMRSRLPQPLTTLINDEHVVDTILQLLLSKPISQIVVGLPRNLDGNPTAQTKMVEDFVAALAPQTGVPITFQDEALTSVKAKEELERRGKPYAKSDIDALAATYILEDYLATKEQTSA